MIRDLFNIYRDAFRQWVRTKTKAKTIFEAEEKRLFWSKCYLLSVSCAIGIYLFELYKANAKSGNDGSAPKALLLTKNINENEPIRVIKYSGFTRVSDETITVKDIEKSSILKKKETSAPEAT